MIMMIINLNFLLINLKVLGILPLVALVTPEKCGPQMKNQNIHEGWFKFISIISIDPVFHGLD